MDFHNEIHHYIHELEQLADEVRQHLDLDPRDYADPRALRRLEVRLAAVARARKDLTKSR